MSDDEAFLAGRLTGYQGYANEAHVHDSDMRVRAYVGEALTSAQARLGAAFSPGTKAALDATLVRCMFADQVFVRTFEHTALDAPMLAALARCDRRLIDCADDAKTAAAGALPELLREINAQFDHRRSPTPLG